MIETTDQIGHAITLHAPARRIVSLVPSQTELLFDLGLADEVIGITKFCIHPSAECQLKDQVGGTKTIHLERIESLAPDLILANKEENTFEDIHFLQSRFSVWTSDIEDINSALAMIAAVGKLTDKSLEAAVMIKSIKEELIRPMITRPLRALYLIWRKPYMAAGTQTFIHHMLQAAGFANAAQDLNDQRYPVLEVADIERLHPDLLLLSSEPYPFNEKHRKEMAAFLPQIPCVFVDGEMFSWYGSRMMLAGVYFQKLQRQINQSGR
jgi:ABC-type Fe3+-hydroxamate transport system substrate-binding protein